MRFLLAVAVVLGALPSGAEANAALDVRSLLAGEDRWRRVLDEVEHDAEGQRRNEALVLEDAYRATVAAWGSGEYVLAMAENGQARIFDDGASYPGNPGAA